jgi:fatty acid desaturase
MSRANGQHGIEWPTAGLVGALYLGWAGLVWVHAALPLPLWLLLAGLVSGLWGSAQHELIHGHPTRSRRLNTALGTPPLWLWLPFERYRRSHLTHHRDERLTDPLDDPESRYLTPEDWAGLCGVRRALLRAQATLAGRLTIGPFWAVFRFWRDEWKAVRDGDRMTARIWAWHALWVALLLGFVLGVAGVPPWQYLVGFVWAGTAVALLRSFAEHRAAERTDERTAIVEGSRIGFLFLFNNLHLAHHRWPGEPWYRLPALYRAHRAELVAANGGLVYRGYRDVFRRFLWRPHDAPVHPLGRAPGRFHSQEGTV